MSSFDFDTEKNCYAVTFGADTSLRSSRFLSFSREREENCERVAK